MRPRGLFSPYLFTQVSIHTSCAIIQFDSYIPFWCHRTRARQYCGNVCLSKEDNKLVLHTKRNIWAN